MSCCAGHSVTLKNNSGEDQLITYRGSRNYFLHQKGYYQLKNISGGGKAERVEFIQIDSVQNSCTFNLPKGKKVRVEGGLGYPHLDEQVIVNNSDTIRMKGDPRTTIKYRWIDYFFTVTVDIRRSASCIACAVFTNESGVTEMLSIPSPTRN